ncbi:hypothetical protein D3C86_849260 [compost metagenome]
MFNLFLETRAAAQITAYGAENGWDDERVSEVIRSAYEHACEQADDGDKRLFDKRLVAADLKGQVYDLDIDTIMSWADTPEGGDFWQEINDVDV